MVSAFDAEVGGNMFIRNVGWFSINYKALYHRIWNFSADPIERAIFKKFMLLLPFYWSVKISSWTRLLLEKRLFTKHVKSLSFITGSVFTIVTSWARWISSITHVVSQKKYNVAWRLGAVV
jgi:hypothetical protein